MIDRASYLEDAVLGQEAVGDDRDGAGPNGAVSGQESNALEESAVEIDQGYQRRLDKMMQAGKVDASTQCEPSTIESV